MGACDLHFNNTLLGRSFNCLLFLSPQNSSRNELWPVFGGLAMFWATGHQPAGLPLQTELVLLLGCSHHLPSQAHLCLLDLATLAFGEGAFH